LSDGTIEGFVGGQCAEQSVRAAALDALGRGEALLLRVLPDGVEGFPELPGAKVVVNPCLSGGALEVFLEPMVPPPVLYIVGETPIADAVAALAESLGFAFAAVRSLEGNQPEGAVAVIVASHGREEPESIRAALDADVRFVGLVASGRRGDAVLGGMELTKPERERVHTPVGLDIGARTAAEVALSIMASVVRAMRIEGLTAPTTPVPPPPRQVVDPVCGMAVAVGPDTPHRTIEGVEQWYCSTECRDR
jgi:xanthine dehydrogenase accessory factor